MSKLLPIVLMMLGGAIGSGAGFLLKPEPPMCDEEMAEDCAELTVKAVEEVGGDEAELDYVAMKNQFVVPVIRNELVQSLVVLSLSLETMPEHTEALFSQEPKLRDAFLRALFDHSHIGGFDGAFTESGRMDILRTALLEAAQAVAGKTVSNVLITEIARQEM